MALYEVTKTSYIAEHPGGLERIHEAGERIRFDGWPGDNLKPLDPAAKRVKEHYDQWKADKAKAEAEAEGVIVPDLPDSPLDLGKPSARVPARTKPAPTSRAARAAAKRGTKPAPKATEPKEADKP